MSESIEPHYRTPRTQSEAGIDWMVWEREPWWKSLSGAIALTVALLSIAFIATYVLVP